MRVRESVRQSNFIINFLEEIEVEPISSVRWVWDLQATFVKAGRDSILGN